MFGTVIWLYYRLHFILDTSHQICSCSVVGREKVPVTGQTLVWGRNCAINCAGTVSNAVDDGKIVSVTGQNDLSKKCSSDWTGSDLSEHYASNCAEIVSYSIAWASIIGQTLTWEILIYMYCIFSFEDFFSYHEKMEFSSEMFILLLYRIQYLNVILWSWLL